MYEFVFCFADNGQVQWSGETAHSLRQRLQAINEGIIDDIEEFVVTANAGEFLKLHDGTMIFCCSMRKSQNIVM